MKKLIILPASNTACTVRGTSPPKKKRKNMRSIIGLYAIMSPVLIHIFIFSYLPLYGVLIAFQDYNPGAGFFDLTTKWVGFKHFTDFMSNMYFWRLIKNTLFLSLLNIGIVFWTPVIFALLLNEIRAVRFKKVAQTVSYLPHFISAVVVAGMVLSFTRQDGLINQISGLFGINSVAFQNSPAAFPWIYTITNIWKSFGFSSILYLSSMAAIDPGLYEAARLDGANRMRQLWHITLPMIRPTIVIQLIFAVGSVLNANSELILLLYSPAVYTTSDVIGTFIYRDSLLNGRFSYGTAVGLFTSTINFIMVYVANYIARKTVDFSLW
ncbi:MAG: ABC transporter permease subunit [Oscillospiraceae bacterium]